MRAYQLTPRDMEANPRAMRGRLGKKRKQALPRIGNVAPVYPCLHCGRRFRHLPECIIGRLATS